MYSNHRTNSNVQIAVETEVIKIGRSQSVARYSMLVSLGQLVLVAEQRLAVACS